MAALTPSRWLASAVVSLVLTPVLALCQGPAGLRPHMPPPRGGSQNRGEHLAQWMDHHKNLSPPQQQRALESEPGFRNLAPQVQQRMRDRLSELNNMPPERRQRIIARTEAMEQLSPEQRQQVRGAALQLGSLPDERRRAVARAFRDLRNMPPEQRQEALASDRFRSQFSDQERSTLSNLVAVEPYIPMQRPVQPGASPPGTQPPAATGLR